MNVREMHIEVNQSLQKVAANRTRKFLSQETDWVLNKMVDRFIQSKLRPKGNGSFEIDELEVDAISNLIVPNKILGAYIQPGVGYISYLPCDYKYLIADSSFTQPVCGMVPAAYALTLVLTSMRQEQSQKTDARYYETVSLAMNATTLNIPADLPYFNKYTGYVSKEDVSFLVPYIRNHFKPNFQVYWERFADVYQPNHYIIVAAAPVTATMNLDGIVVTQVSQSSKALTLHLGTTTKAVANRLVPSSKVPELMATAYYKSAAISPISELSGNNLYVYSDSNFIVTKTRVTYIKEPQVISLDLGTDCDLSGSFHQQICDLAVEYLKGRLENPQGTQAVVSDNDRRVIL